MGASIRLLRCAIQFCSLFFFFFNDTATTEIYTLSLHDALPILREALVRCGAELHLWKVAMRPGKPITFGDRKSTRLNSSHSQISYAVFCLKKKNNEKYNGNLAVAASAKDRAYYDSHPGHLHACR